MTGTSRDEKLPEVSTTLQAFCTEADGQAPAGWAFPDSRTFQDPSPSSEMMSLACEGEEGSGLGAR